MKRFKKFLLEANIFEKPSEGTFAGRTLIGSSGARSVFFKKFCSDLDIDDTDSFIVSNDTPMPKRVKQVQLEDGEICYDLKGLEILGKGPTTVEFDKPHLWMKIEHDSDIIHVVSTSQANASMFSKGATGIKWNESNLETAALMGIFLDDVSSLIDLIGTDSDKVKSELFNVISQDGYDWKPTSVSTIKKALTSTGDKEISTGDLTVMCMLANGMSIFIRDNVNISNINFVHNNIDGYYNVEPVDSEIVKSVKDNTADAIISNVSWGDLKGIIQGGNIEVEDKDGFVKSGNTVWYQVSLKKAFGKAQLGKVTSYIKTQYNLDSADDIWSSVLEEGFFGDILSKGKKIISKITTRIESVLKGFFKRVQSFVIKRERQLQSQQKGEMKDVISDLGFGPDEFKLQKEAKTYDELSTKGDLLVSSVNKEMLELYNLIQGYEYSFMKEPIELPDYRNGDWDKGKDRETPYKLFANICAIRSMKKILTGGTEGEIHDKLIDNLVGIYADMVFGKTQLPLWKVYGTVDGSHAYEYLTTYEDFSSDRKSALESAKSELEVDDLDMLAVRANISKNGMYYNIESALMWDYKDGEFEWSQNRMGTNQGGEKVSWVFEGSKTINAQQYKDNFKI